MFSLYLKALSDMKVVYVRSYTEVGAVNINAKWVDLGETRIRFSY